MDYEGKFVAARQNVDAKLKFIRHLAFFCAGNGLLTGVDLVTTPGQVWFYWPLLIWTLVLGVHGRTVLGKSGK